MNSEKAQKSHRNVPPLSHSVVKKKEEVTTDKKELSNLDLDLKPQRKNKINHKPKYKETEQNKNKEFTNMSVSKEFSDADLSIKLDSMSLSKNSVDHINDVSSRKNISWGEIKLKKELRDILSAQGYISPSPVQAKSIPYAIEGKDMLIRAKNGTGKTLSFVVPILNNINIEKNELQAIILVPIRELAFQISKILISLGKPLGIKSMPIVGGSALTDDILRLSAGTHILVGTPGRVVDLLGKKLCEVSSNPIIIFDEADKLLDSIFFESIFEFMNLLPQRRQLLLYSATFPGSVEGFVKRYMRTPLKIKISEGQELENIKQFFVKVDNYTRLPCLKSLLFSLNIDQCIIYTSSIQTVRQLAEKIISMGLSCYFIHSGMNQEERMMAYHNFSKNKCKILVSTDITTRGLDVPKVNLVINFDLPYSSESYLHRIGRAGRFGTEACAVTLVNEDEKKTLETYVNAFGMDVSPVSDPLFKKYCLK